VASPDGVDVQTDGQSIELVSGRGDHKHFVVDQVFDARTTQGTQAAFFDSFGRELVKHSLDGYNVCAVAYGHTGSGKTYTILGDGAMAAKNAGGSGPHAGLIPRCVREVFAAQEVLAHHYSCEFYEVYQEQVIDLLQPAGAARSCRIHVHPRHGARVENLTISVVASAEEALRLLDYGMQMRAVAATTMNTRSSRSHAIFTVRHETRASGHDVGQRMTTGRRSAMTFVDLAGREQQSTTHDRHQQLREMCAINTSLFHLAHLISKLTHDAGRGKDKRSLADFRNSKLTLLLSPALVGNSWTAVLATLSPMQCYFEDSLSTMNFAQSVRKIQTLPAVNDKSSEAIIAELDAEVRQLRQELATSRTHEVEKEHDLLAAEALIESYKRSGGEKAAKNETHRFSLRRTCSNRLYLASADECLEPFFTKLCDDPLLQGRCNYFLKCGTLRIGSDDNGCDIVLRGLGIAPCMCEVRNTSGTVTVELLYSDEDAAVPRVLVAGRPLSPERPSHVMKHADSIVLGYSHAFRLVTPGPGHLPNAGLAGLDILELARQTVHQLDVASALTEVTDEAGTQFKQLAPYIGHLSTRAPEDEVRAFLSAMHLVCPLVDEANLITREVFGESGVCFRLQALTDVFNYSKDVPEFVVCVLRHQPSALAKFRSCVEAVIEQRRRGLATGARYPMAHALGLDKHMTIGGQEPLLYVWSLEKFLARLNVIRVLYQDNAEGGDTFVSLRHRLSASPFDNPWSEATLAEKQLLGESATHAQGSSVLGWLRGDFCSAMSPRTSLASTFSGEAVTMAPQTALATSDSGEVATTLLRKSLCTSNFADVASTTSRASVPTSYTLNAATITPRTSLCTSSSSDAAAITPQSPLGTRSSSEAAGNDGTDSSGTANGKEQTAKVRSRLKYSARSDVAKSSARAPKPVRSDTRPTSDVSGRLTRSATPCRSRVVAKSAYYDGVASEPVRSPTQCHGRTGVCSRAEAVPARIANGRSNNPSSRSHSQSARSASQLRRLASARASPDAIADQAQDSAPRVARPRYKRGNSNDISGRSDKNAQFGASSPQEGVACSSAAEVRHDAGVQAIDAGTSDSVATLLKGIDAKVTEMTLNVGATGVVPVQPENAKVDMLLAEVSRLNRLLSRKRDKRRLNSDDSTSVSGSSFCSSSSSAGTSLSSPLQLNFKCFDDNDAQLAHLRQRPSVSSSAGKVDDASPTDLTNHVPFDFGPISLNSSIDALNEDCGTQSSSSLTTAPVQENVVVYKPRANDLFSQPQSGLVYEASASMQSHVKTRPHLIQVQQEPLPTARFSSSTGDRLPRPGKELSVCAYPSPVAPCRHPAPAAASHAVAFHSPTASALVTPAVLLGRTPPRRGRQIVAVPTVTWDLYVDVPMPHVTHPESQGIQQPQEKLGALPVSAAYSPLERVVWL
jgi:hypothetical protein